MRIHPAAFAACALVLAGCGDYDDDSDDVVAPSARGTASVGDPFASVDPLVDDVPRDDGVAGPYFAPVPVPGSTFGVAGLYDASIRRPLGVDTRYVYITNDGLLVVYDYDLDPYGTGLNCYRDGRPLPLVRDRGDDYLLDGRAVRIVREDLGIGYAYVDVLDDDRDGDIAETLYYRYPRVSGLAVNDFGRCR